MFVLYIDRQENTEQASALKQFVSNERQSLQKQGRQGESCCLSC